MRAEVRFGVVPRCCHGDEESTSACSGRESRCAVNMSELSAMSRKLIQARAESIAKHVEHCEFPVLKKLFFVKYYSLIYC